MKTVEEVIAILQSFPPKSRIMIGDENEGTIRDIGPIKLQPSSRYWDQWSRNGELVVEIEAVKTDEFWESFHADQAKYCPYCGGPYDRGPDYQKITIKKVDAADDEMCKACFNAYYPNGV